MKQVAEKLGVTESCYCLYENGKRKASFDTLVKLAKIFGCTVNDFT
ncbi:MAG: helix-turn-helix transcriptional regulator [Clostridia bacterium]|nr:helix-turn-helix transcriptional regulator [Clostridia bacterium]